MNKQIRILIAERDEFKLRPAAPGTDEEVWEKLAVMTRDAWQSGEEVRGSRAQLANALTLASRAAPAAPQAPEDRGQKFPDSPHYSE